MLRRALLAVGLALALALVPAAASAAAPRVLLFTKTAGFRHTSIGPAVAALTRALPARGTPRTRPSFAMAACAATTRSSSC
jgi:hypothetical protein